ERWIYKRYGEEGFNKLLDLITYKRVYVYHSLVDKYGGIVSQFEDTMIITRQGPIITTKVLEL
ncbi:MAG: type II methionyl aminopeptidase, partial [Thermoprotei archaeon]